MTNRTRATALLALALFACSRERPKDAPAGPRPEPSPPGPTEPGEGLQPGFACPPSPEDPVAGKLGAADPHRNAYGDEPAPEHVRLAWPTADPSTGIGFVWGTDADTLATQVEYGTGGRLSYRLEGASRRLGDPEGEQGPDRLHEVSICGLSPGTTYTYRVGGPGAWSPRYTFTTPPAPEKGAPLRIAVVGDSRGGGDVWADLLAAIDAQDPDFVLFAGDAVHNGDQPGEWDDWFAATGDVLARRVLIPTHGNHEVLAVEYFQQFALPGNEQWFTYRIGDLQLVVLNDVVADPAELEEVQPAYLDSVFGGSDAPWRIVLHHRTAWSTVDHHGSAEDLQRFWVPRFEANEVDLVIAAHNHAYERTVPIRAGIPVPPGEGPTYLTTGGAGADLYDAFVPDWFSEVAVATHHYVLLDLTPTELRGVARDLAGNTIDEFVLPQQGTQIPRD